MLMCITGYDETGGIVFTQTHHKLSTKQIPILIKNGCCAEGEVPDRPEVTRVEIQIHLRVSP